MKKTILSIKKDYIKYKYVYIMALPVVIYFFIFNYIPMYGVIIAFKNFNPGSGIVGSPWVGIKHFTDFFNSFYFVRLIRNTFLLNIYDVLFGFPAPIILALSLNELNARFFKRTVQTITYMPHFISVVVVAGVIIDFTSSNGLITQAYVLFGGSAENLLANPSYFRTIFISSNIWQNVGFGSVIYLAAISGIDPELYEAATIDGAKRINRIWHITIPGIAPTIIILLILRFGTMLTIGFEKVLLLYTPRTYEVADVISTFVYRKGLLDFDFSYSAAIGLFNSLINCCLLVAANMFSRKVSVTSLW